MQQVAFLTIARTRIPSFYFLSKKADIPIKVYPLLSLDKVLDIYFLIINFFVFIP